MPKLILKTKPKTKLMFKKTKINSKINYNDDDKIQYDKINSNDNYLLTIIFMPIIIFKIT